MPDVVQVKAMIPRELKRRAFVVFAAREEKFSRWVREQLELWLQGTPEPPGKSGIEREASHAAE
jgi:hypothetical protein